MTSPSSTTTAESPSSVIADSDFVVILAALLCALICVIGLVAVARCAWLRRTTGHGSSSSLLTHSSQLQQQANRGLKKKILRSLPKLTFDDSLKETKKLVDCAICLTEFDVGDEIRILPQCNHGFHVGCIDTWLGSHSSCPSCRQILVIPRCQKCGGFPTTSDAETHEAELKAREDDHLNQFLP